MPNVPMLPSVAAVAMPPGSFTEGGFQLAAERVYNAVAGTIVQVLDADVVQLAPRGWIQLPTFGTTAQRPASPTLSAGAMHVDSTVSKTVVWDGANWRDVTTGSTA
jgi:hypothetical protein